MLGVLPSRKYEADGGPTLSQVAQRLRALSARPAADLWELIRGVIFCAIGGNADGHAKNLAMLYADDGPRLAPAYDLVCTRAYPRLDHKLAFSVGGERNPDRLGRDNWEKFAADIGVKPRLVLRQLDKLLDGAEAAFERAAEQLREQVGKSHATHHVSPAVHKRIRAIGAQL
ncbi:type II toxin-antitoxin system HipA family toxin [Persicimonas caeni]|uniref:Type II toxin-antitoxin system HipA family toxin n=1 Tax=Persicimonas caeni TaxID=2292766 RepID=A0A4Y6PRF2_PERCE|nr:type II toxin-antitoxin system HipA family toxin [Persicimonas caeni]QED31818.1 type II toxin-antitoxin system HipA family toxin [Persicimonas caeni]